MNHSGPYTITVLWRGQRKPSITVRQTFDGAERFASAFQDRATVVAVRIANAQGFVYSHLAHEGGAA